jgi:lipopolysaccharide export system protein LptA
VRGLLCLAAIVVTLAVQRAGAQPAPVTVEADTISYDWVRRVVTAQGNVRITGPRYRIFADAARYDLGGEVVVATGQVRIVDDRRRELRGQTLTYFTQTEEVRLEPSEGIIDPQRRVFVRAARARFTPQRITGEESFVTSCDPRQPLVHVTARRIEIVPGEELVAHDATVFFGSRRILGMSRLAVSLVPGEEGVLVPGFGHNTVDGLWVDHRVRVRLPSARGLVHLKYGTQSGLFGLLTLAYPAPAYTATLRLGRTQTVSDERERSLLPYHVAEIGAQSRPVPVSGTPWSWSVSGAAGWFEDQTARVSTTRLDGQVLLQSSGISVAPRLSVSANAGVQLAAYGTGAVRTIAGAGVVLSYAVDPVTTATAGYTLRGISGASPLTIAGVDPASTVSLGMTRAVTDRYLVSASVAHNFAVPETIASAAVAFTLGASWEVGVSAVYNFRLAAFDDIDYTLRRLCDCVDVVVRYRQVRSEVSIELGLVGFTQRPGIFVPRSTPRPPAPGQGTPTQATENDPR